ncbi:MAG: porin family protein [bacterium]|nr:porin family protein [bacterium]
MKRVIFVAIILIIVSSLFPATAERKGTWSFGLNAGLYQPPQDNSSWAPLISARATYWWTPQFNNSLDLGYSWYTANLNAKETGISFKYIPVTLRNNYHFLRGGSFDPYASIGMLYTRTMWASGGFDGLNEGFGLSGGAGARVGMGKAGSLNLGIEYVIPDVDNFDEGYPQFIFGLGLGGII